MSILDNIITPEDLRKLPVEQLPEVCKALREFIIQQVSVHPGHFGSSLGAVDLTVALHYVFNTPEDRIVWDVGHQAYAHKILTGRRERFETLRQKGGLSGFPTPSESEYDTFSAGHASNSISAALGMAVSAKLKGETRKVVAVIGDASIAGGMAFEGLNNASTHPNDMLIILNDNQMAIDPNVGAMHNYLTSITMSERYNLLRNKAYITLKRHNLIGDKFRGAMLRFTNAIKSLVSRHQNIFEGLDIRYFGPVDGHNVVKLVDTLQKIKNMSGPRILHLCTIKGKGYKPAEDSATLWHAPGKFNVETGEILKEENKNGSIKFQDVFGLTLLEMAEADKRIVGITPAMPTGCSMTYMMSAFPDRTFDVGIAEEHAVTFSGGLAKEGLLPFCNIYSAFMQRAMDQVINDVALQRLHVVFCLDRAGLVGADGPTHHGMFDIAYFRAIPGMNVCSPMDETWLRKLMFTTAKTTDQGPFVIRYPRGKGSVTGINETTGEPNWRCPLEVVPIGKGRLVKNGGSDCKTAVLTLGPLGALVEKLAKDIDTAYSHYDMIWCKPLDNELLSDIFKRYTRVVTIEDSLRDGGFGSAVLEQANVQDFKGDIIRLGIPDMFVEHASVDEQRQICGFDNASIIKAIKG